MDACCALMRGLYPSIGDFKWYIQQINPRIAEDSEELVARLAQRMMNCLETIQNANPRHLQEFDTREPFFSADLPPGYPPPPTREMSLGEFECYICYRVKPFENPSDWVVHIQEDLQLFSCTWPDCHHTEAFGRKSDWIHHENVFHIRGGQVCAVDGCGETFPTRREIRQHLDTKHGGAEIEMNGGEGHKPELYHTQVARLPQNEPCCFCRKTFSSWTDRSSHLARHMEYINLPILCLLGKIHREESTSINIERGSTSTPGENLLQMRDTRHVFSWFDKEGLGSKPTSHLYSNIPIPTTPRIPVRVPEPGHGLGLKPAVSETRLLDYFLSSVWPIVFPIFKATECEGFGEELILPSLQANESYRHCCLMMAAQNRKAIADFSSSDDMMINVSEFPRYRHMVITTLQGLLSADTAYERVLETVLVLILSQCWVGPCTETFRDLEWSSHMAAAYSLVNKLDYPAKISDPTYQIPFDMSLVVWIDILGSAMMGRAPVFKQIYNEKYLSQTNNSLGLRNLMGCDDNIMYLISEIACLEALKKDSMDAGDLHLHIRLLNDELVQRGNIKSTMTFDADDLLIPQELTGVTTALFHLAAQIYLCSLDPGFLPEQPSCVKLVENVISNLLLIWPGPNGFDRSLIWVYFIAGSFSTASSGFREEFEHRAVQLGDAAKFGNFGRVACVLRAVWLHNDTSEGYVHYRDIMQREGWDYLLI
ncbi:fungal-specific transcription factor domain-containing protein [Hypoxylon trugodes]|uniref:fungal-specific transcription factor domain-containing protein n=1 Tax=Hypoxylon trugodes TaxID=326681 RepID=UPI002192D31B|nr:fungal-specific transcription factor domain-containing protein [Hypoxylon trugodes]KAI1388240.1 fungal-specific transcription factor domain-containing protein [Hypoxylon trugodes]